MLKKIVLYILVRLKLEKTGGREIYFKNET